MLYFSLNSFGQTAIFLLGGQTKDTSPTAMFLHSGDIIIMGGPARLAYHAVPKILPGKDGNLPQCLQLNPELSASTEVSQTSSDGLHCTNPSKCTSCSVDDIHERTNVQTDTGSNDFNNDSKAHSISAHISTSDSDRRTESLSVSKKRSNESEGSSSKALCTEQSISSTSNIESRTSSSTELQSSKCVNDSEKIDICSDLRKLCCNEHWGPLGDYMKSSRINVSVRQVMKPGQGFPETIKE